MMKKILRISGLFSMVLLLFASCNSRPNNPNTPDVDINFSIQVNNPVGPYGELAIVGNYMYLTAREPSRGIIIYRKSIDDFMAYDRMPPNNPDACGEKNRLYVDMPFVYDGCTDYQYNILDGSIFKGGDGYPMIQYHTQFDGTTLRVYN